MPSTDADPSTIEVLVEAVEALWPDASDVRVVRRHDRSSARGAAEVAARFAVVPSAERARLLVPERRRAAAGALRRYSSDATGREIVQRSGAAGAVLLGGAGLLPDQIEVMGGSGDDIVGMLADVLGCRVLVSLGVGSARANRKPVLGVFSPRGHALAYVKVGDSEVAAAHVRGEAAALASLASVALREVQPPRLLHEGVWRGMFVLVMSALRPSPLQRRLGLADAPRRAIDEVFGAFDEGTMALAETAMWRDLGTVADRLVDRRRAAAFGEAMARLEQQHGDRSVDVGAWHGDFAPWNLARSHDRVLLWDWERFQRGVPRGMDLMHWVMNLHTRSKGFDPATLAESARIAESMLGDSPRIAPGEVYIASLAARYLLAAQQEGGEIIDERAEAALGALGGPR